VCVSVCEQLKLRKERGEMPFTVLSCDNIPENGPKCQALVIELADKVDPLLGAWVREHCKFPMTMVDRITPLTSEHDRRVLAEQYHIEDAWPVVAEDYMQWVIEDKFVDGCRPTYEVGIHRHIPRPSCFGNAGEHAQQWALHGDSTAMKQ